MRSHFVISILFIITSCNNKVKTDDLSEHFRMDSITFEKFPQYALTGDLDTIYAEVFELKGGYQLMMYPEAWYDTQENKISYNHLARLIGEGIDTVFMGVPTYQSKMLLRYDSIDFDECFVIEYSGGGSASLYIDVIEKKTARLIVEEQGASNYDLMNQLILYEAEGMNMMIYDAKRKRFYEVDMPDHLCYGGMGARFGWNIEKVTNKYIYLSHPCDAEIGSGRTKVDRLKYAICNN